MNRFLSRSCPHCAYFNAYPRKGLCESMNQTMRTSFRGARTILSVLFIFTGVACMPDYDPSRASLTKLRRLGGPIEVTDWTLKQNRWDEIFDGLTRLTDYMSPINDSDEAQKSQQDAVSGYLRIHKKLVRGWPELSGQPADPLPDTMTKRERCAVASFSLLARAGSGNPVVKNLYLELKPLNESRELTAIWASEGKRLRIIP